MDAQPAQGPEAGLQRARHPTAGQYLPVVSELFIKVNCPAPNPDFVCTKTSSVWCQGCTICVPGLSPGERNGEEESGPAIWGRTCGKGTPSRDEALLGVGRGLLTARSGSAEPLQRRVAYPEEGPGQDRVGTRLPMPGPSPEGELRGAARPIWFFAPDC